MPAAILAPASPPPAHELVVLMPYFLLPDTAGHDPRLWKLADGKAAVFDRIQAAWVRLMSESSHHKHNGYLTESVALRECHGRRDTLDLLCEPVLGERPLLHRKGDKCDGKNCLDASDGWVDGFEYRLCEFSKRNPTRAENERNAAQKADSKDTRLRNQIYERDAGCCRYCRSGPLSRKGTGRAKDRRKVLQFDHPNPDHAAGTDGANYVVACARCNEYKGRCTPDEADMLLLPVPTDVERTDWLARDLTLLDPPEGPAVGDNDNAADNDHDNALNKTHRCHSRCSDGCLDRSRSSDNDTAPPCPAPGETPALQAPHSPVEGSLSGRVGQPPVVPDSPTKSGTGSGLNELPVRGPDAADIYHHRSRGGDP